MAQNILTPNALAANFPFSPSINQILPGSSPHPHIKRSPYGGTALQPSLSSLGLLSSFDSPAGGKFLPSYLTGDAVSVGIGLQVNSEDAKKKALENVLKVLKKRPGRISEDGVERLAKRAGLEFYRDDTSVKGVHMLSISGTIVVVDIDFKDGHVSRVGLSFANTPGAASDLAHVAAAILEKTLVPKKYPLTSSLAAFADNIERLASLDRLSSNTLNCFSAISGLYSSLRKIWDKESGMMGEREAMCKGMGRPSMHVRGRVGLSIDYWKEKSLIKDDSRGKGKGRKTGDEEENERRYWRVIVEVQEMASDNFITPVRTSEDWVFDDIFKLEENAMFDEPVQPGQIDWQEPPLSNLDNFMVDEAQPSTMAHFIARFDPPIIVGFQDEIDIMNAAGLVTYSQAMPSTLDMLLYPRMDYNAHVQKKRTVWLDETTSQSHSYSLNMLRPCYGRVIEELPFSHPRQLLAVFQILRKYTLFTTLFQSTFGPTPTTPVSVSSARTQPLAPGSNYPTPITSKVTIDNELDAFMSDDQPLPVPSSSINLSSITTILDSKSTQIDMSISPDPLGFSLVFPASSRKSLAQLDVQISINGSLTVAGGSTISEKGGQESTNIGNDADDYLSNTIRQVIETTEDLGIAVEFMEMKTR